MTYPDFTAALSRGQWETGQRLQGNSDAEDSKVPGKFVPRGMSFAPVPGGPQNLGTN